MIAWSTRNMWMNTVSVDWNIQAHLAGALLDNEHEVGHYPLGLIFFVGMQFGIPVIHHDLKLTGSFRSVESLRRNRKALDTWSQRILEELSSGKLTETLPGNRLIFNANRSPESEI
jgi:hypothetical protein